MCCFSPSKLSAQERYSSYGFDCLNLEAPNLFGSPSATYPSFGLELQAVRGPRALREREKSRNPERQV